MRPARRTWRCLAVVLAILGFAGPADAHPAPFSFVDVRLQGTVIELTIVAHAWDVAYELGVEPPAGVLDTAMLQQGARRLETLFAERLQLSADGQRLVPDIWSTGEPLRERQSVRFRSRLDLGREPGVIDVTATLFPYDAQHQTFLNVYEGEFLLAQQILGGGQTGYEHFVGNRQGTFAVVQKFVPEGIRHILIGPDHLLFLVGLLLLGGTVRQLLLVVTGFTVAHSITLSLAVLNVVTPPGRLVEPVIALSIIYVGVDNLMARGGRDMRVWIALVFGLIHGFGFASVLRDMGLPTGALGWSLFSFNLGVEIGQLAVAVVVAAALIGLQSRSEVASRRLATAGSIAVIAVGTFWFIERVFFQGGIA